jgi:hypothetical protein
VYDLQFDLRALGYHAGEISGSWGLALDAAIRAIRHDLTHPSHAPQVAAFNREGRVRTAAQGGASAVEPALAACIAAMVDVGGVPQLPRSAEPAADNRRAVEAIARYAAGLAPAPFLGALLRAMGFRRHFREPVLGNVDDFIEMRPHRDDPAAPDHVTSRAYGLGALRLDHHPPSAGEVTDCLLEPDSSARDAVARLASAFGSAVPGEERRSEWPISSPRPCVYRPTDPRHLSDCRRCAQKAKVRTIRFGSPVHPGARLVWGPTARHPNPPPPTPDRTEFPCDWPYAARVFAGEGLEAHHARASALIDLARLA